MKFISKLNNEHKILNRYWIAFATIVTGVVDLFTLPFRYTCDYQVDVITKVMLSDLEDRKKARN